MFVGNDAAKSGWGVVLQEEEKSESLFCEVFACSGIMMRLSEIGLTYLFPAQS